MRIAMVWRIIRLLIIAEHPLSVEPMVVIKMSRVVLQLVRLDVPLFVRDTQHIMVRVHMLGGRHIQLLAKVIHGIVIGVHLQAILPQIRAEEQAHI
jgi:hypothetical protein